MPALGPLAPAAAVGRVHGRQPRLRPPRRLLDRASRSDVDVERLRRYSFIGERGLTLYEPGLGALEMFLTRAPVPVPAGVLPPDGPGDRPRPRARCSGRAIRAIFGDGVAGRRARAPTPTSTSTRCSTRPPAGPAARTVAAHPRPGDGHGDAGRSPTAGGRSCCAGRAGGPRPRSALEYEAGGLPADEIAALGPAEPGRVAIDLATVDARPADATATDSLLAVEGRDGSSLSPSRARSAGCPPTR